MAKSDWGPFEDSAPSENYNIIWAGVGEGGSGKTHFALTAPDPIAYFLFDPGGLKSLRENPLFREKELRVIDFSKLLNYGQIPRAERVARAGEAEAKFEEAWPIAMKKARTVIVDKEDAWWEMIRYAHDEVDSPEPKNFGELNTQYYGYFSDAETKGVNMGVLRGFKEVWGKTGVNQRTGKAQMGFTGEKVPRGHKQISELVQINLEHRWDEDTRAFVTKVRDKCRLGNALELLGTEFTNLDFITLAVTLYPDADMEVWS